MPGLRGFLCLLFGTSLARIQRSPQEKQAKIRRKNLSRAEAILLQLDMSHMRKAVKVSEVYSGFEVTCPDCDLKSAPDHAARDK